MAASHSLHLAPLVLSTSRPLRLLTLILFYFTQGFPVGLFFYAIPAWMSGNGASTQAVASVVSFAALPWTLKLLNGFVIDRYTYLPMGRRRIWIIGAQATFVAVLLLGAVLVPQPSDVYLLSALAFAANTAVTFQDVGIDSLAVDIMPDDERAKAAGIMFGAQLLGISAATSLGGYLLQHAGIAAALGVLTVIPLTVLGYGILVRERPGERRLPWTAGTSHPRNSQIQVDAWWPLLKATFRALLVPLTLAIVPVLTIRAIPAGGFEAFHPELFTQMAGWQISQYTNLTSTSQLISGLLGLVVGGLLIDRIGTRAGMAWSAGLGSLLLLAMGLAQPLWTQSWLLIGFIIIKDMLGLLLMIAIIPVCMRLCLPSVAATQFTIYMAIGNFGRPLGAMLAAATAGSGNPQWLYFACAVLFAVTALIAIFVIFPARNPAQDAVGTVTPSVD